MKKFNDTDDDNGEDDDVCFVLKAPINVKMLLIMCWHFTS